MRKGGGCACRVKEPAQDVRAAPLALYLPAALIVSHRRLYSPTPLSIRHDTLSGLGCASGSKLSSHPGFTSMYRLVNPGECLAARRRMTPMGVRPTDPVAQRGLTALGGKPQQSKGLACSLASAMRVAGPCKTETWPPASLALYRRARSL